MTGLLRPHSHEAADSIDTALEASVQGVRTVEISLVARAVRDAEVAPALGTSRK